MLILSKIKPVSKTITYKDIHSSSAVSSKCNAVFTFTEILKRIKKKSNTEKFISPNNINYSTGFFFFQKMCPPCTNSLLSVLRKLLKRRYRRLGLNEQFPPQ